MKQILLIALSVIFFAPFTRAQNVVYVCSRTGAWGTGYNEKGYKTTVDECDSVALRGCRMNGGIDCKRRYISETGGWYGVISARTLKGGTLFVLSEPGKTEMDAQVDARKKYTASGGGDPTGRKIKTWYAYTSPKAVKTSTVQAKPIYKNGKKVKEMPIYKIGKMR